MPNEATKVPPVTLHRETPVHFVGVGGIGMSGLAKLLLESGFTVSGSDLKDNAYTEKFVALGGRFFKGHAKDNVPLNSVLVVSTAINKSNPEITEALDKNYPILHRSDVLREFLHGKYLGHPTTVGITGTHGKTTMTGMTAFVLEGGGLKPTVIAGGKIPEFNTNAVMGDGTIAVAELDESDGTIVNYQPTLSVVANLELDHADHYKGGLDEIIETFETYLKNLPKDAKVFLNGNCPKTRTLINSVPGHAQAFFVLLEKDAEKLPAGISAYHLKNLSLTDSGCYQADCFKDDQKLGRCVLSVPGKHNIHNALFTLAVGNELGLDFAKTAQRLQAFTGMGRRFEIVGTYNGATLVDDYAHHPTEVSATLSAAKNRLLNTGGRLIAIFQPHRYSRLEALWQEFLTSFGEAHQLYLVDTYSAGEAPIENINSRTFCDALKVSGKFPDVEYVPAKEMDEFKKTLKLFARPGDIIMTMGAGDITQFLRGWQ